MTLDMAVCIATAAAVTVATRAITLWSTYRARRGTMQFLRDSIRAGTSSAAAATPPQADSSRDEHPHKARAALSS